LNDGTCSLKTIAVRTWGFALQRIEHDCQDATWHINERANVLEDTNTRVMRFRGRLCLETFDTCIIQKQNLIYHVLFRSFDVFNGKRARVVCFLAAVGRLVAKKPCPTPYIAWSSESQTLPPVLINAVCSLKKSRGQKH